MPLVQCADDQQSVVGLTWPVAEVAAAFLPWFASNPPEYARSSQVSTFAPSPRRYSSRAVGFAHAIARRPRPRRFDPAGHACSRATCASASRTREPPAAAVIDAPQCLCPTECTTRPQALQKLNSLRAWPDSARRPCRRVRRGSDPNVTHDVRYPTLKGESGEFGKCSPSEDGDSPHRKICRPPT
jgi:hypothetical protein